MTLEQIVQETSQWPADKGGQLVNILTRDSRSDNSWKQETRRRLAEIEMEQPNWRMVMRSANASAKSVAGEMAQISP